MRSMISMIFPLFAVACAGPQITEREFNPGLCQEATSYEAGYNDGRNGNGMNSSYAYRCREDLRTGAFKGYKEGFEKGHAEYQKQVEENQKRWAEMNKRNQPGQQAPPTSSPSGPQIVIGDIGISMGNSKKWYCKVEAFGHVYDGFGPNRGEAEHNARSACQAKYHGMHCGDMNCQSNN